MDLRPTANRLKRQVEAIDKAHRMAENIAQPCTTQEASIVTPLLTVSSPTSQQQQIPDQQEPLVDLGVAPSNLEPPLSTSSRSTSPVTTERNVVSEAYQAGPGAAGGSMTLNEDISLISPPELATQLIRDVGTFSNAVIFYTDKFHETVGWKGDLPNKITYLRQQSIELTQRAFNLNLQEQLNKLKVLNGLFKESTKAKCRLAGIPFESNWTESNRTETSFLNQCQNFDLEDHQTLSIPQSSVEVSQETTIDGDVTRDEENDKLKYKRLRSRVSSFQMSIENRMKAIEDHLQDFETRLSDISNHMITKDDLHQFGERLKTCEDTQTKDFSYLTLKSKVFCEYIEMNLEGDFIPRIQTLEKEVKLLKQRSFHEGNTMHQTGYNQSNTTLEVINSTRAIITTHPVTSMIYTHPVTSMIYTHPRMSNNILPLFPVTSSQAYTPVSNSVVTGTTFFEAGLPNSITVHDQESSRTKAKKKKQRKATSSSDSESSDAGRKKRAKSSKKSRKKDTSSDRESSEPEVESDPRDVTVDISIDEAKLDDTNQELKQEADDLKQLLAPKNVSDLPKEKIVQLYNNNLTNIRELYRSLQTKFDTETHADTVTKPVRKHVFSIIRKAKQWCNGVISRYNELDCGRRPLDKKIHSTQKKFGKNSEMSIYEFLRIFELRLEDRGTESEKAEDLFVNHLSDEIQDEIRPKRNDYKAMKNWLIKNFGRVKHMTKNILKPVKALKVPSDSSSKTDICSYYRKLAAAFQKVKELEDTTGIPTNELKEWIYSHEFISEVAKILPNQHRYGFLNMAALRRMDTSNLRGEEAFDLLKQTIDAHFQGSKGDELLEDEDTAKSSANKPKKGSQKDPKIDAHHGDTKKEKSKPKKSKFKFPCPIEKHDHEVGTCTKFFESKPTYRMKVAKGKSCFTCLGPFVLCKTKCKNTDKVSDANLYCRRCKEWSDQNEKSPKNILLCTVAEHERVANDELAKRLKSYLKDFKPEILKGKDIVQASHVYVATGSHFCKKCDEKSCVCKITSRTRKMNPDECTPFFDTRTGNQIDVSEDYIKEDPDEDAVYLLQYLRIGNRDLLIFFDNGANQHLVNGEIAEELMFEVISQKPINVGVAGGGSVSTQYGSYAVGIGPDDDGYYHRIQAQGITNVTGPFDRINLSEINNEVRNCDEYDLRGERLPEYVAGTEAHMIVSLKKIDLQPTLLFTLDSGLGVYRSPFVDIFGSSIVYGGTHEVFTNNNMVNHINVYFSRIISDYRSSLYPALTTALEPELLEMPNGLCTEKQYDVDGDYVTQFDQNPTAVGFQDIHDMGVLDGMQVTDQVCMCKPLSDPEPCEISVHKSKVTAAQRKEYLDADDMASTPMNSCETCMNCKCRNMSAKSKMMSIQEEVEQEAITKSVSVDIEKKRTVITYPFIKDPVETLKKRHYGQDSNLSMANKIYLSQCRLAQKSDDAKQSINKVFKDLIDRGFLRKLGDLTPNQKEIINSAKFRHYMGWRGVNKPDSVSTSYRVVVDATVSGFNETLAKGTNNLSVAVDILMRNRCKKHIWTSDISKMYNMLHLDDSMLPYGLVLYDDDLDPEKEPNTYVMLVAWYGVTSTGNQAGEAVERTAYLQKDVYPRAFYIIQNDRFVDDLQSGSNDENDIQQQIDDTEQTLASGGFGLKFIVRSGESPCENASNDGQSVNVLGYNWITKEDLLRPTFKELNLNKKRRGKKKPNPFPVVSEDDIAKLLESTSLTRRSIIARIAEIFDPLGLWEPYKVQLKLDSKALHGQEWDTKVSAELQEIWLKRFQEFLQLLDLVTPRCVVPDDAVTPNDFRIICLSDAGEEVGGCAIYASYLVSNGKYSSRLLCAKSKLMNNSIPRNELEGIKIMAETALAVKEALSEFETEFLFFTDSTIAMCWCHNINKKLRMFTRNRVGEIRRCIQYITGTDNLQDLPLYHINGKINISDLVTKRHSITPNDLGPDSSWQNGEDWMTNHINEMPITKISDITLTKDDNKGVNDECFPEFELPKGKYMTISSHVSILMMQDSKILHCDGCQGQSITSFHMCYGYLDDFHHCDDCNCNIEISGITCYTAKVTRSNSTDIDIIGLGWMKTVRYLSIVIKTIITWIHKRHIRAGVSTHEDCTMCNALNEAHDDKLEFGKVLRKLAKEYLFRRETESLLTTLSKKKLERFDLFNGILVMESRLTEDNPITNADLDPGVFFDSAEIKSVLPVVSARSELFYSYAMYIHRYVRLHAGADRILRETMKVMYPIDNAKSIIQRVRKDCSRCRAIAKLTLELRMANHPAARTCIAPPFYHCMIDTVFGFVGQPYKNARKTFKVYALIIVCLLTGAVNIMAIEGLETQDVVQALERHSDRYGVPAVAYVDNGTNLIKLQDAKFSIRDVNHHVSDSRGLEVVVSTAKEHESRGRVEAKVKILRGMLEKLRVKSTTCMTAIQWETLFSKISNQINDLPIAKSNSSNVNDCGWELITPNRLMLGRNNHRSLEGAIVVPDGAISTVLLKRNQEIQSYWYQLLIDHLHHLIPRPTKWTKTDPVRVGDICIFIFNEGQIKDEWRTGRVVEILSSDKVVIEYCKKSTYGKHQLHKLTQTVRSPRKICVISAVDELYPNSREYHDKNIKKQQ